MKTLKSKISLIAKVSLVFILLGFFGKKTKTENNKQEARVTIEARQLT